MTNETNRYEYPIELEVDVRNALSEMYRAEGVTALETWLVALAILASKYLRSDCISVEVWLGDGAFPTLYEMDLSRGESFRALLRAVHPASSPHPPNAFTEPRRRDGAPTADLILPPELSRYISRLSSAGSVETEYQIRLAVNLADGDLRAQFRLNEFRGCAAAARLAGQMAALLEDAVQRNAVSASQLRSLSSEDQKMLETLTSETQEYNPECIHTILQRMAHTHPGKVALRYEGASLTYGELDLAAIRVASDLSERGYRVESLVGVCVSNPLDAVAAFVGILKAGCTYVPLDPDGPIRRLRDIVDESGLSAVITSEELRSQFEGHGASVIRYDQIQARIESSFTPSESGIGPDNAAYVIFTSGSTGRPKGVVGLHRSVTSSLAWAIGLAQEENCCINASFTFGSSVLGLFFPLLSGATVVLVPPAKYKDPRALVDVLEHEHISRISLVPPHLRQILNLGPEVGRRLRALDTVIISGAAATSELVRDFFDFLPHTRLIYAYSATEIGSMATRKVYTATTALSEITIGQPVLNSCVYILDSAQSPCPVGVIGEIYVGNPDMPRGYLNRLDLTQSRFVADPFASRPGSRIYRTGDLGRILPSGEFQFIGRADNQVKIRGIRVELEEIEAVISAHPGVDEVVVGASEASNSLRLTAYLVMIHNESISVSALQEYLRERLPDYMMPSRFITLDALPRTPNGKVNRSDLPSPNSVRPDLETPYEAPRTSNEACLAEIWRTLLGFDRVGIHDHFLDLGGDSLLAVQIVVQITSRFDVEFPIEAVFEYPTIAAFASEVLDAAPQSMHSAGAK